MKKYLVVIFLSFVYIQLHAQETKTVVYDENAELREVDGFNAISVSGGISLYVTQGNKTAVAISADNKKDIEHIKTEVKNGVLSIFSDNNGSWNGWSWKSKKLKAYVTVVDIKRLTISGGSIVKVSEALKATDLKIEISGASILKTEVKTNKLQLNISGASIVNVSGNADSFTADVNGASIVKATDCEINDCKLQATGASIIKVGNIKILDAQASGASSISYKGSPNITRLENTGSSTIKKQD